MDNTVTAISKEEYLKKYLSKDNDQVKTKSKAEYVKKYASGDRPTSKLKKRRKKLLPSNIGYKIIDDDIDVKHSLLTTDRSDHERSEDEVPLVVSVEDNFQFQQKLDPRNWTVVGGTEDTRITENNMHKDKNLNLLRTSRHGHCSGSDQTPPRIPGERHDSDSDQSITRTSRMRHDSGSDQSPPRTSKLSHKSYSDHPSLKTSRVRHASDSDKSPFRTSTVRHELGNVGTDQSPSRKSLVRCDSGSDQSPPRTSRIRHDSGSDLSPPRASKEAHNTKQSLCESKQRKNSGSDQSPPRVRKSNEKSGRDFTPPRKPNKRHDVESNVSVQKTRYHSDSDQSPPRTSHIKHSPEKGSRSRCEAKRMRREHSPTSSTDKYSRGNDDKHLQRSKRHERSPPDKTFKSRQDTERNQSKSRQQLSPDSDLSPPRGNERLGKFCDQALPHSSKSFTSSQRSNNSIDNEKQDHERPVKTLSGLKAGLQTAKVLRTELEDAKAKESEQFKHIGDEILGKGAQTVFRDRSTGKLRDLKKETEEEQMKKAKENEMKAKYNEWGKGLKQQDDKRRQIESEMHEMNKPLARYEGDEDLERHLKEQEREGDPMLQFMRKKKTEGIKALPMYQGPPPPPNRFNIRPGYRWDGVDRSNGFENKLFERQSNKMALDEEAYKWSVENM